MKEKPLGRVGSVVFDEHTPDEEGFAAVFAHGTGSRIRDWNENRSMYATLREKRIGRVRAPLIILAASTGACMLFGLVGYGPYFASIVLALGIIVIMIIIAWTRSPVYKGDEPTAEDALNEVLGRFGLALKASDRENQEISMTSKIWPAGNETESAFHFGGTYRDLEIDARWLVRFRSEIDKDGNEWREPTFRGWFIRLRTPFDFDGTTVIVGKKDGNVANRGALANMDGVQLEDRAFADRFAVYSTDQVETRVILTPDVMHHLGMRATDLGKTAGDLMLAFEGGVADIALPQSTSAFLSWHPQDMAIAVDDIHAWFSEIRRLLSFIDGIDTLAEAEGFRAERSRNARKDAS